MKIDLSERNFTAYVYPHHNHASNPSKEDVGASFHDVKRVIGVIFAFGPVGTDEGPVGTREPSVEGVFVANVGNAADLDLFQVSASVENPIRGISGVVGLFLEHRNGDAPRDLARDVPIFEILKVIDKDLFLVCGGEFDLIVLKMLDSCGSKALDIDKPLCL